MQVYIRIVGRCVVRDELGQEDDRSNSAPGGQHARGSANIAATVPGYTVTSALPALPKPGETFTEEQLAKRFDVPSEHGIRISEKSTDIILVRLADAPTIYGDRDFGDEINYDGMYYDGHADLSVRENKVLSDSKKNGNRVLYFVKRSDKLEFRGLYECTDSSYRDDPSYGRAISFKLKRVDAAVPQHEDFVRYVTVVNITKDEDGGYVATAPALPGCITQGETREQAQNNMEEAMSLYLEYLLESGEALPPALAVAPAVATITVRGGNTSAEVIHNP